MQTKYNILTFNVLYKLIYCFDFCNETNFLPKMPSRIKAIFPKPFETRSFINRGSWYLSILNWLYGKLVSSLVSSVQSRSF